MWFFQHVCFQKLQAAVARIEVRHAEVAEEYTMLKHGTIIQRGITSKKIPCYILDSACRWLIVENARTFQSYVERFEFSHVKQIVKFLLVYVNKFS